MFGLRNQWKSSRWLTAKDASPRPSHAGSLSFSSPGHYHLPVVSFSDTQPHPLLLHVSPSFFRTLITARNYLICLCLSSHQNESVMRAEVLSGFPLSCPLHLEQPRFTGGPRQTFAERIQHECKTAVLFYSYVLPLLSNEHGFRL